MKGHVNSSGFPLQIGLENLVNDTYAKHGWKTLYTEHSWKHPDTGDSGFIDLVFAHTSGTQFMVVECKRVKDTSWIFLNEETQAKQRRHAKAFIYNKTESTFKHFEWGDLTLEPSSPESQFCVIPGTDNRSKSLIERSAAELIYSTESLACEDRSLSLDDRDHLHIYFNVIVTTAKLQLCTYKKSDISISDGVFKDSHFEEVPFVRFRKQLSPDYNLPEVLRVAGAQNRVSAKENTVFVVNSEHLVDFLVNYEIDETYQNKRYWG